MKIYTRTGDKGDTGLIGGRRVRKTDLRIVAIGDVDELNASIGMAVSLLGGAGALGKRLERVQCHLFDAGAELANAAPVIGRDHVAGLEREIDSMTAILPPLTQFILPGGSGGAAALHFARTVCRRAERSVLALHEEEAVGLDLLRYLNRLSDWLFTAARTANVLVGAPETEWHGCELDLGCEVDLGEEE